MKESGSNHRAGGFLHLQSSSFSAPFGRGTCSLQGNCAVGLLLCLLCQKRKNKSLQNIRSDDEKEIPNTEELIAVAAPCLLKGKSQPSSETKSDSELL